MGRTSSSGTTRTLIALCLLASALAAAGCRGLVGVQVEILDEPTLLERQVLGHRAMLDRGSVLLSLGAGARVDRGELLAMDADYQAELGQLAAIEPHDFSARLWEGIILHNRGVLHSRLGRTDEADALFTASLDHCTAYALDTLRWQVLQALGDLRGGDDALALYAQAAEALESAPLLTGFEFELEDPDRRDELYGRLISAALDRGDDEGALNWALRRRAVELARACAPGSLAFPPGPVRDLARELAEARDSMAQAREELCKLPLEQLAPGTAGQDVEGAAPAEVLRLQEERGRLAEITERVRENPAVGGLLAPIPADPFAVQSILSDDTALLMFESLGPSELAGFLLSPEGLVAKRLPLPEGIAAPDAFSQAVLAPFAEHLAEPVSRLYLVYPRRLADVPWHSLPLLGQPLGERFQLAFLGGPSDLEVAFAAKSYGRQSFVICRGGGSPPSPVLNGLADHGDVEFLDVDRADRNALLRAAADADFLWFANPLVLNPEEPAGSYLAVPSARARLGGIDVGVLASMHNRSSCAGFANASGQPWSPASYAALRVLVRSLAAGGMPTVVWATGQAPEEVSRGFWERCLSQLPTLPVGDAYRLALADVPPEHRGQFRLFGFLGMNQDERAQYSKLEFNDRLRVADAHLGAGEFEQAAVGFRDLWHMADAMEFATPDAKLGVLAGVQSRLVRCWSELRDYERAAEHQRLRVDNLAEHTAFPPAALALEYQSLGALLTKAERFDDAMAAYRRSIEILKEHGEAEDLAKVLGELGKSFDRAAQYGEALKTFEEALESYRAMADETGIGRQLQRIGALYLQRLGLPERAEQYFSDALDAFKAAGDAPSVVDTKMDLGLCRRYLGDFDGALKLFEDALKESRQAGLELQEARALAEIGNTQWFMGRYQEAFQSVNASTRIASRLDAAFQLNVNYQLLGLIWWELSDFEKAHKALDEAVVYAERAEMPLEVASAYNNRGIILRRQERYEEALEFFGKALAIDERLLSRWGQGYDHRNIGMTLHRMERYDEAAAHLEEAVRLSEEIGDAVNLTRALFNFGDLRLSQGRLDEAEALLRRSLESARAVSLPEVEWRALRALGLLERRRGDQSKALDLLKQAVDVVEELRGQLKVEEFRSGFLTGKMDLYEDTVALLLEMGRSEDALAYAERSRARNFIDILAGQTFELKTEHERELYAAQQNLAREIRSLMSAAGREEDSQAREALMARIEGLRKDYAELLIEIRAANPQLSSFVSVEVVPLDKLQALLAPKVSLVVYYMMQDELAIWVVQRGEFHLRRVEVDRERLSELVKAYRLMVQKRELLADVRVASKELYDLLIAPVEDLLAGSEVVGIVPHRALHYLSFASLYDGKEFLVERFPLFYVPSASVLPYTLAEEVVEPRARQELKVLAVADPAVGDPAYELPFSEKEVRSLARDFVNVTSLVGEKATESWLAEHISEFDVVHFAAHGYFDSVNPLFSALVLAPDAERHDDGILEMHEVSGLKINAGLVTLSACQSGLGRLEAADELVSLSRAFMYAGTRAILSTLWRVDDVSTSLLAKHFYRYYAGRAGTAQQGLLTGKAASLRYAQLQVMNDGDHYHPMYWAGMTLTGDYR